ncbi:hypothetical protein HPP92_010492 [Vanilla planifolia]|uniref:Protein kinase domain-containing protein n=1 Tax=Vanilla planifolia TaxID=51239 RepID=A0A835UXL1_VANPL|nr:hypothetical protein HPP92_010492 [Vanilla planifolia]
MSAMAYVSMGEAHRRITDFLFRFSEAVSSQDGAALKPLLAVSSNSALLLSLADALNVFQDWGRLVKQADRNSVQLGEILTPFLRCIQNYRMERFVETYVTFEKSANAFLQEFRNWETAWALDAMYTVAHEIRVLAELADKELASTGKNPEKLQGAGSFLMKVFGSLAGKGPKRVGALYVTSQLFKVYFKLGTVHLCRSVIRSIETAKIFDFEEFPTSDKVTYMYYTGRLEVYNENFIAADQKLTYALMHCNSEHASNLRMILKYLVPVKLSIGILPTMCLLDKYNLAEIFIEIDYFYSSSTTFMQRDLSSNNLSGDLPNSLGLLSNLSSLYLQNNQFTGSVDLLSNLDLENLNIANNHFTGWIPQEFHLIPNLQIEGNNFENGPAPPPPPYAPPPPHASHNHHNRSKPPAVAPNVDNGQNRHTDSSANKKSLPQGSVIGIVSVSVFVALCAIFAALFILHKSNKKSNANQDTLRHSLGPPIGANKGEWHQFSDNVSSHAPTDWNFRIKEPLSSNGQSSTVEQSLVKRPPSEKMIIDKISGNAGSARRPRVPITAAYYSVASLQAATNSFSPEFLIGEGFLGRVYKAEISNGKILAVKKLDSATLSLHDEEDFLDAVSNISQLRHPNITTLVGYCAEFGQHLLVYEYIGNGTLHDILHFSDDSSILTWNARVKVALGTARALEYLHEVCSPPVVHRSLKSANILLDEELSPHISDCGLAALTHNSARQAYLDRYGSFIRYSAPEFVMSGIYTIKSDVYSFGVVMLELLTGRKALDSSRVRSEQSLVRWAMPQLHDIDALSKMVDPALKGIYPAKSLSRFADVIALCVQPEPEFRPPMSEVVQALVKLMQRTSLVRRGSTDEVGFSYRIPEHEATSDMFMTGTF